MHGPSALVRLYVEQGQSPWVVGLHRRPLRDGTLTRMVRNGIRGVVAQPSGFAAALASGSEYDEQLSSLVSSGQSADEAFREIVATDVESACAILQSVHRTSQGRDGFVSVEISPTQVRGTRAAVMAARWLHQRVDGANLLVAVPASAEGLAAARTLVAEGRNVDVTAIFSLRQYAAAIEAYLAGLEALVAQGGDPSTVRGTASFEIARVDEAVGLRLRERPSETTGVLLGHVALAQARLAYGLFEQSFETDRWGRLASLGALPQRLLWASVEGSGGLPGPWYVDRLVAPDTVTAIPAPMVTCYEGPAAVTGGSLLDVEAVEATDTLSHLGSLGIDLNELADRLQVNRAHATWRLMDDVLNRLHARRQRS
jgi:transaldolase